MRSARFLALAGLSLLLTATAVAQDSPRKSSRLGRDLAAPAVQPNASAAEKAEAWRSRWTDEAKNQYLNKFKRRTSASQSNSVDGEGAASNLATPGDVTAKGVVADDCEWSEDFVFGGLDGAVYAQAVFDDGTGEALYVGGEFEYAAGVSTPYVAKWDGTSWSALGLGMDDVVFALEVFDDGTGEALYAGGYFTTAGGIAASGIAKWDGSSWSPVGTGVDEVVFALEVFDDGGGPALYAGGYFVTAGGGPANSIAKWDGTTWSPLGTGMDDGDVYSLAVFDDGLGGGPALYAGGVFNDAGGVAVDNIAKWDGMTWSALGLGTDDPVLALEVFDDGGGDTLYAGGLFFAAGGMPVFGIAQWNGAAWSTLATGMDAPVFALTTHDDGGGDDLYAGGVFSFADIVESPGVARWDGTSWSAVGPGIITEFADSVDSLGSFDDGGGGQLFAGGFFFDPHGSGASFFASWDAVEWSAVLSTGPSFQGTDDLVFATALFDDGTGEALYAGGYFYIAGDVPVYGVAKWDGTSWAPLGQGMSWLGGGIGMLNAPGEDDSGSGSVEKGIIVPVAGCGYPSIEALAVFDDGTGPALYAGGEFDVAGGVPALNIAKWDGTSWSALDVGTDALVEALAVFDDGTGDALFVGGEFDFAGGVLSPNIARWDGAGWTPLATGMNDDVETLAVFDDGGGDDLYAGGEFDLAGGVAAMYVARWDGTTWSALGSGMDDEVETLYVYDDGGGDDLYAGGQFDSAGGIPAPSVARWDGTAWSGVGGGMASGGFRTVDAFAAYSTSPGATELYAGGYFEFAGGMPAGNIARWDGTMWSPLGLGTNEEVETLAVFDDGDGAALYAGGYFYMAGGVPSDYFGRWKCPSLDFGDAPDPDFPTLLASDGARHTIVPGFYLGSAVDAELDALPDAAATGDDLDGSDDEDGVSLAALVQGAMAAVTVEASAPGVLDAWFDWNGDGDWTDGGEKAFDGESLAAGTNNLSVAVPSGAVLGSTHARFRFSTAGSADPAGRADDGEVEDYEVTIEATPTLSIDDVSLAEGDAGTTDFVFTLTRSHNLNGLSVDVATSDGTALAGADYTALPLQTVGFTAGGLLSQTVTVSVVGDTVEEVPMKTFFVDLSNPVAATILDEQGLGTIVDDDDKGPPAVTQIDSTAGTVDGELTECEEARVDVASLHAIFDQPMYDPAGDADAADVSNPANYRLFAAGADRDLSTTSCGPAVGDDVEISIESIVYEAITNTATLELAGGVLGDDSYRLVVCDTVTDPAGNGLTAGDFLRTFRVERDNLFANGNFDCDLVGWSTTSTDPGEIAHGTDDVDSAGISGSAVITNLTSSTSFAVDQCVTVAADTLYELSGWLRVVDTSDSLFFQRTCDYYSRADCAGVPTVSGIDVVSLHDSGGGWELVESPFETPPSTQSMSCRFELDSAAGTDFTVHLDALRLVGDSAIFLDGFESGDTSNWSGVVP